MFNKAFIIFCIVTLQATVFVSNSIAEVRMVSSPPNSQQIGNNVSFTPTSTLDSSYIYQYRIKIIGDTGSSILRDWDANLDYVWNTSGYTSGRYHLQLRAKQVTSTQPYDEIAYKSYELLGSEPVIAVSLSTSPQSEQVAGQIVIVSSIASYANIASTAEYQYLLQAPGTSSPVIVRTWGGADWLWDTSAYPFGNYIIGVQARTSGSSTATYEAQQFVSYTLNAPQPPTNLTVNSSLTTPQTIGVSVGFTATSEAQSTVEYQYLIRNINKQFFDVIRDWGESQWSWDTVGSLPGTYAIQVRVRNLGSNENFELKKNTYFRLYDLKFQDVTDQAGLTYMGESWGGSWGDMNGDKLPDLWITNHRKKPSLFINNGDGSFTDMLDTLWTGISYSDAHGTAWADVDNDGDQDILQVAGGGQGLRNVRPAHYNQLFINENGHLTDDAVARGVSYETARGRSLTWLDWNNDGLLDVFYTVENNGANPPNKLLTQQPNGIFQDESAVLNIVPEQSNGWYAPFFHVGSPTSTYLMPGNWRVPRDVYPLPNNLNPSIFSMPTVGLGSDVATGDFNGDLVTDIYIARTEYQKHVYTARSANQIDFSVAVNNGNNVGIRVTGTQTITYDLIVPASLSSNIHIGAGDYPYDEFVPANITQNGDAPPHVALTFDRDDPRVQGISDITINDFGVYIGYEPSTMQWTIISYNRSVPELGTVYGSIIGSTDINPIETINFDPIKTPPADKILSGQIDPPGFIETPGTGIEEPMPSESVVTGDFDNDMDLDIYVLASTRIQNLPNALYLNLGDGKFHRITGSAGAEGTNLGRGENVIVADFDTDGFLDLLTFNGRGEPPFNEGPRQLFKNQGNTNHWLEIDLVGDISNTDGLGAIVTLITPNGKRQIRERDGGMHGRGQNHKRLHFGLGPFTSATVIIDWPSGITQKIKNVSADQLVTIAEAL